MDNGKSWLLRRISGAIFVLFLFVFQAWAQPDPNPDSPTPILISESDSTRALAIPADKFTSLIFHSTVVHTSRKLMSVRFLFDPIDAQ